jgi:hypothetical protein
MFLSVIINKGHSLLHAFFKQKSCSKLKKRYNAVPVLFWIPKIYSFKYALLDYVFSPSQDFRIVCCRKYSLIQQGMEMFIQEQLRHRLLLASNIFSALKFTRVFSLEIPNNL